MAEGMAGLTESVQRAFTLDAGGEPEQTGAGLELVLRAARGDQRAFGQLYAQHQAMVFQVLSRLVVNAADGADLTQEAFLKAWEKLPSLREPERFKSWLLRIVVNTAFNWRARRKRERLALRRLHCEESSPAASEPVIVRESADEVARALAELSSKLRTALVLRYVAGLAYVDVARTMRCGEITARTRVARGLSELGKRLSRHHLER